MPRRSAFEGSVCARHRSPGGPRRRCAWLPLSLVQTGDRIRLSVKRRSIDLLVDDKELTRRAAIGKLEAETPARGYARLYAQEILGALRFCILKATLTARRRKPLCKPAVCRFIRAVIALGRGLDLPVVADGVETEEQLLL